MNSTLARMQTLVGQAGEALGITEDPFSTVVGCRILEATKDDLDNEDWSLNMEICDIINHTEEGPNDAVKAIKKRLHQCMGKNSKSALFTLTLLETCVKNCGKQFRVLVCQKEFAEDLVQLECPGAVREQLLGMLQSWSSAFGSDPTMTGVADVVTQMRVRGVVFPEPSTQDIILTSSQIGQAEDPSLVKKISKNRRNVVNYGKLDEDQIRKLKQDLEIAGVNLDIFNELLTELTPGQEHPEDKKLLDELGETCMEMQRRVVELLGVVENRELTSHLLDVNDNINNQLLRYERYNKNIPTAREACSSSQVTSTDDVLLEVPAGPVLQPDPIGGITLKPKNNPEYQEVDLLGFDETQSKEEKESQQDKTDST